MHRNAITYWLPSMGLVIMLLLAGCKGSKVTEGSTESKQDKTSNQLQFVTFELTHDSINNKTLISLLDLKTVNGSLKSTGYASAIGGINSLIFYQYCDNKKVDSVFMAHPLYHNIEYIDGQGGLNIKTVTLGKASTFIRLRKGSGNCELRIFETLQGKGTQPLSTIKL